MRQTQPLFRAYRSFWTLTALAVLAMGALSAVLTAPPGPVTAVAVAGLGLAVVILLALAGRVLLALERTSPRRR